MSVNLFALFEGTVEAIVPQPTLIMKKKESKKIKKRLFFIYLLAQRNQFTAFGNKKIITNFKNKLLFNYISVYQNLTFNIWF